MLHGANWALMMVSSLDPCALLSQRRFINASTNHEKYDGFKLNFALGIFKYRSDRVRAQETNILVTIWSGQNDSFHRWTGNILK
jgi:hypothetical protein